MRPAEDGQSGWRALRRLMILSTLNPKDGARWLSAGRLSTRGHDEETLSNASAWHFYQHARGNSRPASTSDRIGAIRHTRHRDTTSGFADQPQSGGGVPLFTREGNCSLWRSISLCEDDALNESNQSIFF